MKIYNSLYKLLMLIPLILLFSCNQAREQRSEKAKQADSVYVDQEFTSFFARDC